MWRNVHSSAYRRTRVSLMFASSKRSHRSLRVDEFFMTYSAYSIACAALSLGHPYHSPYSLLSAGMTWHFLLIICCYLYALFDMTAPHFPWVRNYFSCRTIILSITRCKNSILHRKPFSKLYVLLFRKFLRKRIPERTICNLIFSITVKKEERDKLSKNYSNSDEILINKK